MISQIIFLLLAAGALGFFGLQVNQIRKNILLGRPDDRSGNSNERFQKMLLVAFGQQKMFQRLLPAVLHFFIYAAFLLTQIELIEIFADGLSGSHRLFGSFLGGFYTFLISFIEVLSLLALVATVTFLARRNLLKIPRFHKDEMTGWPKLDGNIILYLEILLIIFIFTMNGADEVLYNLGATHAAGAQGAGSFGFAVSRWLGPALFGNITSETTLHILERIGWWGHLMVVFGFMIYLPISKHFHIIMAFPNTWYSDLKPAGQFSSPQNIQEEIKAIMDPSYTPATVENPPHRFGARDVTDLTWKTLMDAYTCTECGRCTSVCPANLTGKKLSPRKVIMDIRDRLEEVQKYKLTPDEQGVLTGTEATAEAASHTLLGHYVTEEELRACTTCNACVDACPVNINPVTPIIEMRRYLVMEESKMPDEWAGMSANIENNGAPWAFPAADRFNWSEGV
ncbi:MAG: (Fe-S)-binding protein [Bacteroidia bacterium]